MSNHLTDLTERAPSILKMVAGCIHCLRDERTLKLDWALSPQIVQDKIQTNGIVIYEHAETKEICNVPREPVDFRRNTACR